MQLFSKEMLLNSIKIDTTPIRFDFTGVMETWIVPKGVNRVFVEAAGGKGTSGGQTGVGVAKGGNGGKVFCVLQVTTGQTLNIFVGDGGKVRTNLSVYNDTSLYNLFPDGGGKNNASAAGVSGGGGSTSIRTGTTKASSLVVAGGGGGAINSSTWSAAAEANLYGGAGGGLIAGRAGRIGEGAGTIEGSGKGGTQNAGGAAGTGGAATAPLAGTQEKGGSSNTHAGTGGGGWYGGGGGNFDREYGNYPMCGGGGGSSYTHPVLCSQVVHEQGTNSGKGYLIITPMR